MNLHQGAASTSSLTMRGYLPWLFLLLLTHAVLTLPVALLIDRPVDQSFDEQGWHYPNVLLLAEKWPALDWQKDMLSEIAPGYHYFLAGISQITGTNLHTLRAVNVFVSLSLLAMLYMACLSRVNPRVACMLLLPMATSNYFIKTAAFIYTDKAGLFLAAAALLLSNREKLTALNSLAAGAVAACASLSRQIHFWLIGPLLWRALEPLLAALSVRWLPAKYHWISRPAPTSLASTARRSILHAVTMAALPVAALLFLIAQWGGVVREPWRAEVVTLSTTGWAYLLALLAILAPFYLLPVASIKALLRDPGTRLAVLTGIAFGLFTAIAYPNAYNEEVGHYGGSLWNLARRLPVLFDRSPLFLVLSPVGGGWLVLTVCWLHKQRGLVVSLRWFVWVSAWASIYLIQTYVYQRYFIAPLLMFMALALAFGIDKKSHKPLMVSLGILTFLQLALTVMGFLVRLPW